MKDNFVPIQSKEGWVYANPLPDKEELRNYYAEQYYQQAGKITSTYQTLYSEEELEHKHFEADLCLNVIKSNFKKDIKNASILELGSGEGFFLKTLSKNVDHFRGVDFSDYGVKKFFPELLNDITQADIYDYIEALHECFDVIVLRNVIEHVPDPFALLSSLRPKVSSEGLIVFSFPNDFSLIQNLSKKLGYTKKDFWFCPPDHLYYFNTETIKKFIKLLGFSICDMFSIFPVDLFLLHPGSHYVDLPDVGKLAHKARMEIELALWKQDEKKAINLFRQFAENGIGREITIVLKV